MTDPTTSASDEPVQLSDLYDQVLPEAVVDDLFRDLELAATILQIRYKASGTAHSAESPTQLSQAKAALLERRVAAVQILYRYREQSWFDTLMNTPAGVRLVRAPVQRTLPPR